MTQALTSGANPGDPGYALISVLIFGLLAIRVSQVSLTLAGSSRLPLVAGWDNLLPKWFTQIHPRWGTPVQSILFVGAATFLTGLLGIAGVGRQEGFQLLQNACGILYGLTYLVMFALPLVGLRKMTRRAPLWLRAAAFSGFVMTALYVVLSVFPIIDVQNPGVFTAKVVGVILIANLLGAWYFWSYQKRRRGQLTIGG